MGALALGVACCPGRLTLWNDFAIGHEGEYEAWYQDEHLNERLGVPGFMRGRRYQVIEAAPEYLAIVANLSGDEACKSYNLVSRFVV